MYIRIKRCLDFLFAFVLLIIFSLPMAVIAAAIKITEGGQVLFCQQRPGKGGKIFTIYKFRTMYPETDKKGVPLTEIERITRLGSFLRATSLDELPQLFNVLCGNMSFVGPRPLLVEYLERYSPRQARRHEVLPGITGFAQVNGRNAITWDQKFEYDVIYVENVNLFMDLKILAKTVINVLKCEDINSSRNTTMERFTGSNINTIPQPGIENVINGAGVVLS